MAQKTKSSFRGKVASNAVETSKSNSSYGYLKLPKGVSVFTPDPEGKYYLDFLPYVVSDPRHPDRKAENELAVPGSLWYRRPFRIHRNVGAGKGDTVVCLSSIGKKCPICEHRAKLVKEAADKEEIKALNSSKRMLYIVIPLKSKEFEEELHIFDISERNFQDKLTNELKENDKYEIFPDLAEGYTVKVRFEGETIGTGKPFAVADRIDFEEREQQYDESILKDIPDLDEILTILSYAELEAKFLEMEGEEDAGKITEIEEEEEKKPARSRYAKPKEEEEEEEEEKPKRSIPRGTSGTKPKKEEEEEAEEEEKPKRPARKPAVEEEEEEEEKPKRTAGSKPAGKEKCPHGYKFGVDTDKYKKCDTCDIWSECIAKKEESE